MWYGSFEGCFLQQELASYIQLHGRWIQMCIRTFFSKMQFLPCKYLPISLQLSWKTMPPSHNKTGKAVPWSKEHWNNKMAGLESWSKPNWKSLENPWWQSYGQETHYCHWTVEKTGKKNGPWSHQRSVRKQMCWSHSKQGPVHFLLISDSGNPPCVISFRATVVTVV